MFAVRDTSFHTPMKVNDAFVDLEIYDWDDEVVKKCRDCILVDNDRELDILMKWYHGTLKQDVMHLNEPSVLPMILKHIQFFKLLFAEICRSFIDNYLDNMEDILACYMNLTMAFILPRAKDMSNQSHRVDINKFYRKVMTVLNIYLFKKEDRIFHVLMKMNDNVSDAASPYMHHLYRKLLLEKPKNSSDLAFCRAYILFQKWKKFTVVEEWAKMDKLVYVLYSRTVEALSTSEILKEILLEDSSVFGVMVALANDVTAIREKYFKFIKYENVQEGSLVSTDNILAQFEDFSITSKDDFDATEMAYTDYLKLLASNPKEPMEKNCSVIKPVIVKEEPADKEHDDDECQIVGVTKLAHDPKNVNIVYEIFDDDDIAEILFCSKPKEPVKSFLDLIDITESSENEVEILHSTASKKLKDRTAKNSTKKVENRLNKRKLLQQLTVLQNSECAITNKPVTEEQDSDIVFISTSNVQNTISTTEKPTARGNKTLVNSETQTEKEPDPQSRIKPNSSGGFNGILAPVESVTMESESEASIAQAELTQTLNSTISKSSSENKATASNIVTTSNLQVEETETNKLNKNSAISSENRICQKPDSNDRELFDTSSKESYSSNMVVSSVMNSNPLSACPSPESTVSPSSSAVGKSSTTTRNDSCMSLASPIISSTSIDLQDNILLERQSPKRNCSKSNDNLSETCDSCVDFYFPEELFQKDYNKNNENVSQSNLEAGENDNGEIFIEERIISSREGVNGNLEEEFLAEEEVPENVNVQQNECVNSTTNPTVSTEERHTEDVNDEQTDIVNELTISCSDRNVNTSGNNDIENVESVQNDTPLCPPKVVVVAALFSKFEETLHSKYAKLVESHKLENVLMGPVAKPNALISIASCNFDLFNKTSTDTVPQILPPQSPNSNTTCSSEITSPPCERMDDFRVYYEENKNTEALVSSCTTPTEQQQNTQNTQESNESNISTSLDNTSEDVEDTNSTSSSSPAVLSSGSEKSANSVFKRKRIVFDECVSDSENCIHHSPPENTKVPFRSIMKTPRKNTRITRNTRPRIRRNLMNLKSLEYYNVKPNDPCIQGDPVVVIERLSEQEIVERLRLSDAARRLRDKKLRESRDSPSNFLCFNFEEGSVQLNGENVISRVIPWPSFQQWRSNSPIKSSTRLQDEGVKSAELPNTDRKPAKRKRTCCKKTTEKVITDNVRVKRRATESGVEKKAVRNRTEIMDYKALNRGYYRRTSLNKR